MKYVILSVLVVALVWCITDFIWTMRDIRLLRKAKIYLDQAKTLMGGDPSPSDVLLAGGFITQAEELIREANVGLWKFIRRSIGR